MSNIDPNDIEAKLLLDIITRGSLVRVKSKGIDENSFLVWGDTFKFVDDYCKKYKKLPSIETFYIANPGFPSFSVDGVDPEFLTDSVLRNAKRKKLKEAMLEAANILEDNPEQAISDLHSKVSDIRVEKGLIARYLDRQASSRLDEYLKRRNTVASGHRVGQRTGINALDSQLVTWMPGDFIMIIGPPGSGKSFTLIKFCSIAHIDGKKVLYICPEMTETNVGFRFDVIEGRHYGKIFSLEKLRRGEEIDIDQYAEWIEITKQKGNWVIVDSIEGGKFTVDKLSVLVEEHNPDIVGIDSLTQFTTQSGNLAVGWLDMIELSNSIKTLATNFKNIFIAVGPSTGDTFSDDEPAELSQIGLSRGSAYKPDVILSMSKSSLDPRVRFMKVIKMREGRDIVDKLDIVFDPDCGRIE